MRISLWKITNWKWDSGTHIYILDHTYLWMLGLDVDWIIGSSEPKIYTITFVLSLPSKCNDFLFFPHPFPTSTLFQTDSAASFCSMSSSIKYYLCFQSKIRTSLEMSPQLFIIRAEPLKLFFPDGWHRSKAKILVALEGLAVLIVVNA